MLSAHMTPALCSWAQLAHLARVWCTHSTVKGVSFCLRLPAPPWPSCHTQVREEAREGWGPSMVPKITTSTRHVCCGCSIPWAAQGRSCSGARARGYPSKDVSAAMHACRCATSSAAAAQVPSWWWTRGCWCSRGCGACSRS